MDQFKITGRIGHGAHGYVMKGNNKFTNEEVALKKLSIKNLDEGIPKKIMREITALRVLNHENIVELIEVIPYGMGLFMVMEFLPTNLMDVMKCLGQNLDEATVKCYLKMLLEGVKYMHEHCIMHRDLKPANLLVASDGVLKIGDFGLARIYAQNELEREYSHQVATRWYRAPELLYGSKHYTNAIDMWSVGCIFSEMMRKAPLFPGNTDIEQLAMVLHTLGTPTDRSWPEWRDLPDYNKIVFARTSGLGWQHILPHALQHPYLFEKPAACPLSDLPKPKDLDLSMANELDEFEEILSDFDEVLKDFE